MLASCVHASNMTHKFDFTRIPTLLADVNKFYWNKSTVYGNHPQAEEIKQHAVINLKDVLTHIFAYGTKHEGYHEYTNLYVGASNNVYATPFMQQTISMMY